MIITMMMLNEFLDMCKARTGTESDSNLARKVDVTRAAIAAYRKGSSFPSDENMMRLATRARLDEGACLLLLNVWRSEGKANAVYQKLLAEADPMFAEDK